MIDIFEVIDLNKCAYSDKNGSYGGLAGRKDGISFYGYDWMVKYPKNLSQYKGENASYSTSPLSEFLGSHIYQLLGFDVHDTLLGERNGKIVCACKDFAPLLEKRLLEIRSLKNHTDEELDYLLEEMGGSSTDTHVEDIDELLLHIYQNPILEKVKGVKQRFFEQSIVDMFLNNSDRNSGNWGIIREPGKADTLAPIYDNGGSFSTNVSEVKMAHILSGDILENNALNVLTAYGKNGHFYSAKKYMNRVGNIPEYRSAVLRVVPLIEKNLDSIHRLIDNIPDQYITPTGKVLTVMSDLRREYYHKQLDIRFQKLLVPEYKNMLQNVSKDLIADRTKKQINTLL